MSNITSKDIETFLSVLKWSENCWNYPEEIKHCYNCRHYGLCKKECTDQHDVQSKRIQGLIKASVCDDYIYYPKNRQTPQFIDIVSKEKLVIFFKVLRASKNSKMSLSLKLHHCKQCIHVNVCNKKINNKYKIFWGKGLCDFLFAQGCYSYSLKKE